MTWHTLTRKFNNTVKLGQKLSGNVGRVMQKVSEVAGKIYDTADKMSGGPLGAIVPGASMVKAGINAASHMGTALVGVSKASNVDAGLHSLSSAYRDYKGNPGDTVAPGGESITSAADDPV